MQLIFGYDEAMAGWAKDNIPHMANTSGFGPCSAIGIGWPDQNKLLAAVVYHDLQPALGTCQVSIAAVNPRWAQRGIIRALLSVPFEQYGIRKLWCAMVHDNRRAIRFNKGIGFKQEATLRHHFGQGKHAVITSMMAGEYRKIYGDGRVMQSKPRKFPVPDNIIAFRSCATPRVSGIINP